MKAKYNDYLNELTREDWIPSEIDFNAKYVEVEPLAEGETDTKPIIPRSREQDAEVCDYLDKHTSGDSYKTYLKTRQ